MQCDTSCLKYMQVDSVLDECGVAVPFNVTSQKETFFATKKKHNEKTKNKCVLRSPCFHSVLMTSSSLGGTHNAGFF